MHDLWAKGLGRPLHELWGLDPDRAPRTSFTLAIQDDIGAFQQHARELRYAGPLKLKLGSGKAAHDLALVQAARSVTRGHLCVDANGGWSIEQALWLMPRLAPLDLLFVEQPLAAGDVARFAQLRAARTVKWPPIYADEGINDAASLQPFAGLVDGINVKLAKAGGLSSARELIARARDAGLGVLIGCMIESSVAVTAAAHISPLADFADLDGNLLIANDPYSGVRQIDSRLELPSAPGLGIRPARAS
jgi:L-alanine-DL-glutamate epimerase-like enolase superfamily enzyme